MDDGLVLMVDDCLLADVTRLSGRHDILPTGAGLLTFYTIKFNCKVRSVTTRSL